MSRLTKVVEKWIEGEKFGSGQLRTDGKNLFSYQLKIGRTRRGRKEFIDYSDECGMKMYVTTENHINEIREYIINKIALELRKYHIKLINIKRWFYPHKTRINLHDYLPDMDCYGVVIHKYEDSSDSSICFRLVNIDHPDILYFLNAHAYDYLKALEKYPKIISPEGLY